MSELTGKQLTEKFFTEVKEWKYVGDVQKEDRTSFSCWVLDGQIVKQFELPPLHTSLDLQEEWLWPELRKIKAVDIRFSERNGVAIDCWIRDFNDKVVGRSREDTHALVQLEAGLKALGVI